MTLPLRSHGCGQRPHDHGETPEWISASTSSKLWITPVDNLATEALLYEE